MSSGLRCTAIIPTYNRQDLLSRMLKTLTKQTLDKKAFEVIVVDDGSDDGTRRVATGFVNHLNIRYFFKPREGFRAAAARNIGIREARSELCILIDDGLLLHTRFLDAHVTAHAVRREPHVVIGYVYCFGDMDEKTLKQASNAITSSDPESAIETFREQGVWLDYRDPLIYQKLGDDLGEYPAPWAIFFTCNVSAPTEQLRAVGGFDENFQSWGQEDVDLGYRLYRSGLKFALARDAAAIHIPHAPNLRSNFESLLCNSHYMAIKYRTPTIALLPYIPTPHINEYVLRNRIESCESFIQRTGRDPLLGIRADHPDPEHSLLLTTIASYHSRSTGKPSGPLLIGLDIWEQLRKQFLPGWTRPDTRSIAPPI